MKVRGKGLRELRLERSRFKNFLSFEKTENGSDPSSPIPDDAEARLVGGAVPGRSGVDAVWSPGHAVGKHLRTTLGHRYHYTRPIKDIIRPFVRLKIRRAGGWESRPSALEELASSESCLDLVI
jgi:hypothetical protein